MFRFAFTIKGKPRYQNKIITIIEYTKIKLVNPSCANIKNTKTNNGIKHTKKPLYFV